MASHCHKTRTFLKVHLQIYEYVKSKIDKHSMAGIFKQTKQMSWVDRARVRSDDVLSKDIFFSLSLSWVLQALRLIWQKTPS